MKNQTKMDRIHLYLMIKKRKTKNLNRVIVKNLNVWNFIVSALEIDELVDKNVIVLVAIMIRNILIKFKDQRN